MRASRIVFSIVTAMCLMTTGGILAQVSSGAHTYYVDFANGSDDATGTSQNAAWKHAPGDSQATGAPAKAVLVPGDTVLLRAGVTYRGSIQIKFSGALGQPITYSGQGWGVGRATISGRDVVEAPPQPCISSPICSKMPNPDQFIVIDLSIPVTTYSQIALDGNILQLSQTPKPAEPFWFDDTSNYIEAKSDELSPSPDGKTWHLQNDFIRKNLGDDTQDDLLVLILGYPNVITSGPAISYDPKSSSIEFEPAQFQRNEKAMVVFALANHPRLITQPYEYATIEHGTKIIVRAPITSAKLEVSRRNNCFYVVNQKNVTIRGFEIVGYAAGPKGGGASALAVRGVSDILFDGNDVHDLEDWAGGGAVTGEPVSNIIISNNRFINLPHGSGVRIGKGDDVRIEKNEFDNIGRTGIMVMNTQRSLVDHNTLRRLYGSHGNGISIYRDNHDAIISNNLVSEATRAVTFEGADRPPTDPPNNITFVANLIKGNGGSALQGWGGNTNGVDIERNVLLVDNAVQALRLSGHDKNVMVRRNIIDGYQVSPMPLPSDTSIKGNIFVSDSRGSTSGNDEESSYRKPADSLFGNVANPDSKICSFLMQGAQISAGIGPADLCKSH